MEASLRNRLTFGPIMLGSLILLLWLDNNLQAWTRDWMRDNFKVHSGVGGIGLLIILSIVLPLATREIATLFAAERVRPYPWIAALGSGALVIHAFLTQFPWFKLIDASVLAFIVAFIPLLAALRRAMDKKTEDAIVRMAGTVLACLYLGGLGWFLMAIRVKQGRDLDPNMIPIANPFKGTTAVLLMLLLMVKFTDIGAYFGGRAFGRHKLIPWLSPGKTWEGLFFGLLTAGAVGAAFAPWAGNHGIPGYWTWWRGLTYGVVLGGIGQLGDLLESLMKRDAEVKDSGKLVPGFGGILDIIDSPLVAAPFAYLMFSFV